jgi:serine/threonine-protein kinase
MVEIRLPRGAWKFDPSKPLGPAGGFGAVFEGVDASGNRIAVKKLHLSAAAAAHRELTIAEDLAARDLQHVMPILDAGQDVDSDEYFVVMPVAELSLQDLINRDGSQSQRDAAAILVDVVEGLQEAGHIVHRDLKPGNVLRHEERWKIADFGIARFVEDSTSTETLKRALSPFYAAPEQWRLEHATGPTDIYALGCIAHFLVKGAPPFSGTLEQLREDHLHKSPSELPGVAPAFQTIVRMMLRKASEARPSRDRVRTVLKGVLAEDVASGGSDTLARLASAADAHERAQAQAAAEAARQHTAAANRRAILDDAQATLRELGDELEHRVVHSIPNASVSRGRGSLLIRVGIASLTLKLDAHYCLEDAFPRSGWDVIAGSAISVTQSEPDKKRSASLWFTRRESRDGEYRWCEVGYAANPLSGRAFAYRPIALNAELADRAHWKAMDVVQVAYPPMPIDAEDADEFCERWLFQLAVAAEGGLERLHGGLIRPADERRD